MRLLLDTHVLWWVLSDPRQLPPAVRSAIDDPRVVLLVSSATPWELSTKHRIGKFADAGALLDSFSEQLERLGVVEVPMTSRHGLLAGRLEWDHRDPFDRMLAAQSIVEGARLVTSDPAFSTLPGVDILW